MDGDLVQCASAAQPLKHLFEDDVLEHWRNHCGGYGMSEKGVAQPMKPPPARKTAQVAEPFFTITRMRV